MIDFIAKIIDFIVAAPGAIWKDFYTTVIADNRWQFYLTGIGNTITMTVLASLIGIILGLLIAIVKSYHKNTGKLRFFNWLCHLYTTIIRGTPVLVQLLIIYFIIFAKAPLTMALYIASLAFGLNSGAYVSETIRAGIASVDRGQTEAGRSLGLNGSQTMKLIVLPQAAKNILPALFNEMIMLLKETSVAGYISVLEITRAGDIIRSRNWTFSPLLVSAAIYLVLVMGLTKVQQYIERRMSASDSH